jgi:hypothetical protein
MRIDLGGQTRELKYSYGAIRAAEREAGVGFAKLISPERQGFDSMCILTWAGLRHENKRQTVDQVEKMLDRYIEDGGTLTALGIVVSAALMESGVFGKQAAEETAGGNS